MQPDRVIVLTYRRSDSISSRPEDQNTLTHQSADMNDDPPDLIHVPVTSSISTAKCIYPFLPYSMEILRVL